MKRQMEFCNDQLQIVNESRLIVDLEPFTSVWKCKIESADDGWKDDSLYSKQPGLA